MASDLCPELVDPKLVMIDLITVDNVASLLPSTFDRKNGTVVSLKCFSPTYTLKGSSLVTCINKSWSPAPPTCIPNTKTDTTPSTPSNGEHPYSDSSLDTSRIILIVTVTVCAAILIFLAAVLLYKLCQSRVKSNDNETQVSTTPILPLYTTTTGSKVMPSSWPGNNRAWTYISVDRLIRDMERSRAENPHHSWRDFASISAYSTHEL